MEIFTLLIDTFLPVFIFTDVFIVLFKWINKTLNAYYPIVTQTAAFLLNDKSYLAPEYDIWAYLMTIFICVLIMAIYQKLISSRLTKKKQLLPILIVKFFFLLVFFIFFINQLGAYPMIEETPPNGAFIQLYIFTIFIFIIGLSTIFFFWKTSPFFYNLFFVIIALLIGLMTFVGKFPIIFFDNSLFFGPIIEIAKGKTIFSQVFSYYSFLIVLLLGYLNKFSLFDIGYFPILLWALYVVQYFICFYLIYKISRSIVLACISLFSLLTITFYSLSLPLSYPQFGPIRWLPLILALLFLLRIQNLQSKKFIFILSWLSFFTIDSGLYLILGYGLTLFILLIFGRIKIKNLIQSITWLFISLILTFAVINLLNLSLGYQLINFSRIFLTVRKFSQLGLFMIPIADKTFFWLIILLYFLSLKKYISSLKPKLLDNLLLFNANLTIIGAVYYVGRSHPGNLFIISILFIMNFSIFLSSIINYNRSLLYKTCLLIVFFILFIVYPSTTSGNAIQASITNQLTRLTLPKPFEPEMISVIQKYKPETTLINKYLKEKTVLLISPDDTYLFYLLNKTNLIDALPQQILFFEDEQNFALKNAVKLCPKKIAVDCRILGRCENFITLNSAHYPAVQQFDFEKGIMVSQLNYIQSKCRLKYVPTICTQRLCIAQAN